LWPTHVELNRRSKRRWRARVKVLARAERLGLISPSELQVRLSALTAFAKGAGVKSWRFRQSVLRQLVVDGPRGLEPGEPWRRLEQRRGELPDGEPQHERTDEPHEQQRLSPGPEFRWSGSACPETPDGTDRFPVRSGLGLIGEIKPRARMALVAGRMTAPLAPCGLPFGEYFALPKFAHSAAWQRSAPWDEPVWLAVPLPC
jgi:hypothetical protein